MPPLDFPRQNDSTPRDVPVAQAGKPVNVPVEVSKTLADSFFEAVETLEEAQFAEDLDLALQHLDIDIRHRMKRLESDIRKGLEANRQAGRIAVTPDMLLRPIVVDLPLRADEDVKTVVDAVKEMSAYKDLTEAVKNLGLYPDVEFVQQGFSSGRMAVTLGRTPPPAPRPDPVAHMYI